MNLKAFRISNGLTQQQLADATQVSKRTIEDIEARGDCRVSTAIKLSDALGVTLDELCRTQKEGK